MANHHNKLTVCPNCGTQLGPDNNFCPSCGQENHEVKLPLGHILYEFVESITHFDNKLWNSLKAIFTRPGKMTAEFLEGKRIRYVPPARLYVFVSVIFFFLIGRFADYQVEESMKEFNEAKTSNRRLNTDLEGLISNNSLLEKRGLDDLANSIDLKTSFSKHGLVSIARQLKHLNPGQLDSLLREADVDITDANQTKLRELIALVPDTPRVSVDVDLAFSKRKFKTNEEREAYEEKVKHMSDAQIDSLIRIDGDTPGWLARKVYRQQGKFTHLDKGENTHQLLHTVTKNISVVMFILMPFVAVLLLLFYFRRGRLYYEHLIFSVHIHTVLFILFSLALATTFFAHPDVTSSVLQWTFWLSWLYFLFSLKRVYGQSWGKTLTKFLLLSVMYGFTALLFMIGAVGIGFLTF